MAKKNNKQDYFDYQYQRNLKPIKKYKFFDKIFKIKNGSAATILAEHSYFKCLEIMEQLENFDIDESDAANNNIEQVKEMLELQINVIEEIQKGIAALVGMENMEYIFNYEDEDGAGLDTEELIEIFGTIYTIAKGGNPNQDEKVEKGGNSDNVSEVTFQGNNKQ